MRELVVGVDASRNRSGGARAHLAGLIGGSDPRDHGIEKVHLWAYRSLGEAVPNRPWLVKHDVPALDGPLHTQVWWQRTTLPQLVDHLRCDLLFNTDAGSFCPIERAATLSQDMLSFEPHEMRRYGNSLGRVRLEILKEVQGRRLRSSRLAIFLTEYAKRTIESVIGPTKASVVIPHGIDDRFSAVASHRRAWPDGGAIRCLYVSNAAPYKHNWHVVEAIARLRSYGHNVALTLVGGGRGAPRRRLDDAIHRWDPQRSFVQQHEFVPNSEIPRFLADADLFIFASSCENLPITLLEAMAAGVPICSSNRGPMPEVLGENAYYFDPEGPLSITDAVAAALLDKDGRQRRAANVHVRSQDFTWRRCSEETWAALASVCD